VSAIGSSSALQETSTLPISYYCNKVTNYSGVGVIKQRSSVPSKTTVHRLAIISPASASFTCALSTTLIQRCCRPIMEIMGLGWCANVRFCYSLSIPVIGAVKIDSPSSGFVAHRLGMAGCPPSGAQQHLVLSRILCSNLKVVTAQASGPRLVQENQIKISVDSDSGHGVTVSR
jgi:hypothetical protein